MKTQQVSDAYWTARSAPYVFAVAIVGLVTSIFWFQPLLVFLLVAVLSGALVFFFHVLRWRSGREVFQVLAMASTFIPLFIIMACRRPLAANFQYVAAFVATYAIAAMFFRSRVLRGLNHDG